MKGFSPGNRTALFVISTTFVGGIINYLFHVVTSRGLGPEEYSKLATVVSLMAVLTTAGSAFQATSAREMVRLQTEPKVEYGQPDGYLMHTLMTALIVAISLLAMAPLFSAIFGLEWWQFIPLSLFAFVAFGESVATGRLQGLRRFRTNAQFSLVQGSTKLTLAVISLVLGIETFGIAIGIALCSTLIVLFQLTKTRDAPSLRSVGLDTATRAHLMALVGFWLTFSLDVPLARGALSSLEAGQYAAIGQLGKAVLVVPLVLAQMAYPEMAEEDESHATRAFNRALLEVLAALVIATVSLMLVGRLLTELLLGIEYSPAASLTWKVGLAMWPFALANLFLMQLVARKTLKGSLMLLAPAGVLCLATNSVFDNLNLIAVAHSLSAGLLLILLVAQSRIASLSFGKRFAGRQ